MKLGVYWELARINQSLVLEIFTLILQTELQKCINTKRKTEENNTSAITSVVNFLLAAMAIKPDLTHAAL